MKNRKINKEKAAKTGDQPTLTVAIEQSYSNNERVITDNLAPDLFSGLNRFWIKLSKWSFVRNGFVNLREKLMTGGWSGFLVRKRYIDEKLVKTLENHDINCILNLGAGWDTRLYRFKETQKIKSWEVDQSINIKSKRQAIERALGAFPKHITQVSIDFTEQDLISTLKENGYQLNEKTFFIWEAVSQYLDDSSLEKMFEFYSKAASGSFLAFTYIHKDFIEGKNLYGQKTLYKMTVKGNIWHSGFYPEEIATQLEKYGWSLIEELGYAELNERYVKPTGRKLGVMEIERMVFAEKIK
ncbi:MAG: SAM-dependent methyltransferase [Deltaproteobacteria bacterium]|nr:MAG: SAM-dependent methyltransferase [Deltaproteobacteria bacterium]